MIDFQKELNEAQWEAVKKTDGPIMVIAGAGSGKTRVLTYRIAYHIYKGVDPFRILALTFTNKAAREMKERIVELVKSNDGANVWMGTFHSIFAKILRFDGHHLGYPAHFTIYDTDDAKSLIKTILKEMNLDPKEYTPSFILYRISMAKSRLITPQMYKKDEDDTGNDKAAGKSKLSEIYQRYWDKCRKANAMDFDDLLMNTYFLFERFPDVIYKYQKRFQYVLVDEYQDTNHVQYQIVKKLTADNENLCVVGDDAQSIYAFRGANIQNIFRFQKDYPDFSLFKLEQNYRSCANIVKAANSVIEKNKKQIKKNLWTDNENGKPIRVIRSSSDGEEGAIVANSIFETHMNAQAGLDSFAILYRTNAQSRSFEESLRKLNLAYKIYGGLSFYKRKEIKDLLAYFRLVVNPNDEEALMRIINYPARGIGKTSLERLQLMAADNNISMWDGLFQTELLGKHLGAAAARKVNEFGNMIRSFQIQLKTKNAFQLAKEIAKSSGILKALYEDKSPEGLSRFENIEELLNGVKEFCGEEEFSQETGEYLQEDKTLDVFLQEIALLTDQDEKEDENKPKISLMTIHASKGLEFPYVFVVGMEENLFPSIQSLHDRTELEEERRLFYVAMTRAEKMLTLTYAESRYRWGNLNFCEPSRFLEDIEPSFVEFLGVKKKKPAPARKPKTKAIPTSTPMKTPANMKKAGSVQGGGNLSDFEKIQAGMEVEHQRFGKGKVLSVEGIGPNKKATVFFPVAGQKQLLLRFAKLIITN